MKIKVSDYVARFIARCGVDTVFGISGGASLHLLHSVADHPRLRLACPHHEQAAAMAADGYARASGGIGVAITTSGPGATNLVTGACCSFYDSVPVLLITGQVSTFRSVGDTGVRQIGFQETPIVEIIRPVTKYAVTIDDPTRIRYELEKAVALMRSGRPGPALVDIPDNLQREMVEEDDLLGYRPDPPAASSRFLSAASARPAILEAIAGATRPVVVAGWGIHLAGVEEDLLRFVEALDLPVALTWGAADLLPEGHRLNLGRFGTHGMRHSNFAVQNADLILSLGSRLDTKSTGSPVNSFARAARKIVVDIDPFELGKFEAFGLDIDLLVEDDLRHFFPLFDADDLRPVAVDRPDWFACIDAWREVLGRFDADRGVAGDAVNPYALFARLSELAPGDAHIMVDTGCSIAWSMQAWRFQGCQRLFHDFNNTAMGWSLPASVGSFFAAPERPVVCVIGDGSLMMCLQELATIKHHGIPLKIILINNAGYAMIRQTQDQWLGSRYVASSHQGGLSFPGFDRIAEAFGFGYVAIERQDQVETGLRSVMSGSGPVLCEVRVPESARVVPQVKFGRPNEDMEPLLPRDLFGSSMIIERI